jgi:hypothetical protein
VAVAITRRGSTILSTAWQFHTMPIPVKASSCCCRLRDQALKKRHYRSVSMSSNSHLMVCNPCLTLATLRHCKLTALLNSVPARVTVTSKVVKIEPSAVLEKAQFVNTNESVTDMAHVTAGATYLLIPCTFGPEIEAPFVLQTFSASPVQLDELLETTETCIDVCQLPGSRSRSLSDTHAYVCVCVGRMECVECRRWYQPQHLAQQCAVRSSFGPRSSSQTIVTTDAAYWRSRCKASCYWVDCIQQ